VVGTVAPSAGRRRPNRVNEGAAKRYEVRGKIVHSTDFVIWSNEPK